MRVCTKCEENKAESDFAKHSRGPGGLQWNCRECCAKYQREAKARDPQKYLSRKSEAVKRWELRNPDKVQAKDDRKNLLAHGITQQEYDELLDRQGGCCAICGGQPDKRRFAIDHDHSCCDAATSCGKCVRGLLCTRCNAGIGMLRDNVDVVLAAASYLLSHQRVEATHQMIGESHASARTG